MREFDMSSVIERTSSPFMDSILGVAFPVLDHGFIRVIDYMGDDDAIVQAARVSYGSGTTEKRNLQGLINYLMRHAHTSPFEMCEIKLHVKLPIFVARQWIRHRMVNVNEYSARYSIMEREFYIPDANDLAMQSTNNKQGREQVLTPDQALQVQAILMHDASTAYDSYERLLKPLDEGGEFGLARELARMNLPTNIYTQWYWKIDLHNLFHFLKLRNDPHAQMEIRVYAEIIDGLLQNWVPAAHSAFTRYKRNSITFYEDELRLIPWALQSAYNRNPDYVPENSTLSLGEWKEFLHKLKSLQSSPS